MPGQAPFYPSSSGLPTATAAGQTPVSVGAGTNYTPQTLAGVLLGTTTVASSVASVTVSVPAGYQQYLLISNVVSATAISGILTAQVNTDTTAANYFNAGQYQPFGAAANVFYSFSNLGMAVGVAQGFSSATILSVTTGAQSIAQGVGGGSAGNVTMSSIYAGVQVLAGGSLLMQIGTLPSGNAGIASASDNFVVGTYFKLYGLS